MRGECSHCTSPRHREAPPRETATWHAGCSAIRAAFSAQGTPPTRRPPMNIIRKQQAPAPLAPRSRSEWDPFRMMRDMMRWDPFREMSALPDTSPLAFMPDFDVKETPQAYVFKADLPGIKEKDLE